MKYIIMAAGQGSRWNDYLGITKQEAPIDNETLLQRTARLIRNKTTDPIIILSNNSNHYVNGCDLIKPSYSEYYKSKYAYDLIDGEMAYLYGDTYYSEEVINKIISTEAKDVMFFGNNASIVGLKVKDYQLFKHIIDTSTGDKSLYHSFDNVIYNGEIPNRFSYVGNEVYNINYPEDYDNLSTVMNELSVNKQLICIGVIWNVGTAWANEILSQISETYKIDFSQELTIDDYYEFLKRIYKGDLSEETINHKYASMIGHGNTATVFQVRVPNPHFKIQTQKGTIACEDTSNLKRSIRGIYKPLVNNKSYDNIIHITDTPIETAKTMKIVRQYGIDFLQPKESIKKKEKKI